MAYDVPGPPSPVSEPKPRPGVVTISTILLWIAAAALVAGAAASFATLGTSSEVYEEAYAGTEAEGTEGFAVALTAVAAGVFVLLAIAFVILGIFNNLGRNGSRITTWVLGGVALCCTGGLFALGAATSGLETEGAPSQAEINDLLAERLPEWYEPVSLVSTFIPVVALLVAVVLLMLPPANEFFRKPQEEDVFEPPSYPPPPPPPAAG